MNMTTASISVNRPRSQRLADGVIAGYIHELSGRPRPVHPRPSRSGQARTPDMRSWSEDATIAPSPTAVARRLIDPDRSAVAANAPRDARLPSSSGTRVSPREQETELLASHDAAQPGRARRGAQEQENEREADAIPFTHRVLRLTFASGLSD
jgi:hypothetical protein